MFSCIHCNKEFATYPALNAHQIAHKEGIKRQPSKRNEHVVCCIYTRKELSMRTFNSQLKLIKRCENCNKEFKNKNNDIKVRFCSKTCTASATNRNRGPRKESTKIKISNTLKTKTSKTLKVSKIRTARVFIDRWKFHIVGDYSKIRLCRCSHCSDTFVSRRQSRYCKNHKELYGCNNRNQYKFTFNVYKYPDLFDIKLLKEVGFYAPGGKAGKWNLEGLSRDHKVSVNESIKNNYDPFYITHPLNCELMTHKENNIKNSNSSITYDELKIQVNQYINGSSPT